MESLGASPEKFPAELLLEGRKKNYRSVILWHYKIVYLFTGKEVHVLDIIHTSMNPDEIKRVK
ncbi:MAG: type II toxin-antitoxin system RelE/ParE family toxin [Bacteroidia bacterium]